MLLGTKTRHLSPNLGENFFSDHLILETKFNKNSPKVPQFLENFKNVPRRLRNTGLDLALDERFY